MRAAKSASSPAFMLLKLCVPMALSRDEIVEVMPEQRDVKAVDERIIDKEIHAEDREDDRTLAENGEDRGNNSKRAIDGYATFPDYIAIRPNAYAGRQPPYTLPTKPTLGVIGICLRSGIHLRYSAFLHSPWSPPQQAFRPRAHRILLTVGIP